MGRTWLEVGGDYTSGKDRDRVTAAIEALEWHSPPSEGPLSPVLTLQAVVTELGLPKVSALAWGGGEPTSWSIPTAPRRRRTPCSASRPTTPTGEPASTCSTPESPPYRWPPTSQFHRRRRSPSSTSFPEGLFPLGTVVATPGAIDRMERGGIDARELLARHLSGDWGDIDPDDMDLNDEALGCGGRLLSVYGNKSEGDDSTIWVITEADRSATTILRPEDY